jgi:tetratricopeptide (TPR) repeat protein
MNRFEVAGKMLRYALRSRINFFGEINPKTASTYCQLAMLYDTTGNFPNAEKYYQKDLDISLKIFGELHSGSSDAYNNLGVFYFNQQNYSAALPVYKKALEIRRKILGEKNEDTAASHNNLGYNYLGQVLENYKDNIEDKDNLLLRKAYDYFQQAVKIRKEELRKTEENNLTESYIGFGLVQMHLGQIRRGSVYFNQGLILAKEFYPDKYNSEWANTLEIIGDNFRALKDFKKAEEYYSKSLKIRKKNLKPDHMFIQRVMEKLLKLNS